jgi:archaeosortase B (VPXXXP-CTERM-specific)
VDTENRPGDAGGPDGDGARGTVDSGPEPGLFARILEIWRNPAYRFVILFLLYLLIAATLYPPFTEYFPEVVYGMMTITADIECAVLDFFANQVSCAENLVSFKGFPVKIIVECTGIYEVLIFSAAVLAFPTRWSKRVIGLMMGAPLLYFFNVVRIIVLILVGKYWPSIFDFMHIYFWQATLILMITSVWLLWIFKVVQDDDTGTALRN